jgi:hypothetical protein
MTIQIAGNRCTLPMRRSVLAAIGISFFALSATTFGADIRTADPSAAATATKSLPAGRPPIPAQPADSLAANPKTPAPVVDQLYKELMEWMPPWCASATSDASLRGHC